MGFKNTAIVDYPIEEVFATFIRTAKRDFPKFDEKNPIGTGVTKKVGSYSTKQATMRVEITDYKKNELYQITSYKDKMMYKSTYKFEKISESETKLTSQEVEEGPGFMGGINAIIQAICFRGMVKKRFSAFITSLETAIEEHRKKLDRSKPKDEELAISEEIEVKDEPIEEKINKDEIDIKITEE